MKLQIQRSTLDGFFLRLRLGKLNEAVGKSGYCVARINGITLTSMQPFQLKESLSVLMSEHLEPLKCNIVNMK